MSDVETGTEYKNKHPKSIHLDTYRGVACDLMELNDPLADKFMQVSDMRGDIVIVQKPQDRVRNYDEVGFVRVAKLLKLPKLDFWRSSNELLQTKKEDGTWYIAINDQELADKVARAQGDNRKFDERFVDSFRKEVKGGLATILKREKLLNSGKYNLGFLIGYKGFLVYDLLLGPVFLADIILSGNIESMPIFLGGIAALNAVANTANLALAGFTWVDEKLSVPGRFDNTNFYVTTNFTNPFVKPSLVELIMPPVPVDRLVRGLFYLSKHGDKLINPINAG